jgi:hypothetical protein
MLPGRQCAPPVQACTEGAIGHLGVVASVHGYVFVPQDLVHMSPGKIPCQASEVGTERATRGFEDENAPSLMAHEGGATHTRTSERDTLDAERVEPPAGVVDPSGTPAE